MDICGVVKENRDTIIYVSLPELSELCCVMCEIDFVETRDSSAKSDFHWRTMKCRLLILLVSDVIAAPILGTERRMFIIAQKEYFQSGKLERVLKNFKLVYQGSRAVTGEVYKNCLIFTIQCKIAPSWNMVGQYFVQGKDFFDSPNGRRALILNICIAERNTHFQIQPVKIKLPCVKLEDFCVSERTVEGFFADPKGYIDLARYNTQYAHVLPSMKRGKVLSVSKELPQKCIFKDYDQLRRHWKNMYGYFLPRNKEAIVYYDIKFPLPNSNVFTYPNVCLTAGQLEIIPNRDRVPTVTQFLSDLIKAVPNICGEMLQISKQSLVSNQSPIANISLETRLSLPISTYPGSSTKIEFSGSYGNKNLVNKNDSSALYKTHLAKIDQIHNTATATSVIEDSINKDIVKNEGDVQRKLNNLDDTPLQACSTQRDSNIKIKPTIFAVAPTLNEERSVSQYFPIRKTQSDSSASDLPEGAKRKKLTLKEKLSNAKPYEHDKDGNIDVEAMAKNNRLNELKKDVLIDWLKQRSIPYRSRDTKAELINMILSHMKNTTVLQKFRV